MLIVALMVVGGFSFFTLGVDLFPKIDLPTVSVSVSNPGASAEEVETDITKRVEDAVNTISGIDDASTPLRWKAPPRSSSQFSLDKNGDVGAQEIRDKVNLIVNDLPDTAKAPVVQKFDPDATPIMQIALSSPRPLREVTEIADKQIKPQLENINGIGQIQLVGGLKREIRVWVDPDKMRAYNLAISDVANALRQQNMEMPAGNVNAGARELAVRTLGRLVDPAQFNEIAIATRGSYVVKLRDIGYAEDSQEEPTTAARLNGDPAVTMVVSKQSGQNTVAAADALKERIKQIEAALPKDIHIQIINDQSIFIKATVHSLEEHLIEGSILAAAIVFAFLANIRTTLISALAIPTSIISTFALMAAIGFRFESDHHAGADAHGGHRDRRRHYCARKYLPLHGGEGHVALSGRHRRHQRYRPGRDGHHVFAAGRVPAHRFHGRHRRPVHVVVRIHGVVRHRGLAAGVFHADAHAYVALRQGASQARGRERSTDSKDSRFFRFLDGHYTSMLEWSMAHRKTMVAISVAVVLSTVPLFMVVGKNFIPADDRSEFQASVRAPEGTSLAATVTIAERIARDIRALPGVTATLTSVGIGSASFTGSSAGEANSASIYVKLVPRSDRKELAGSKWSPRRARFSRTIPRICAPASARRPTEPAVGKPTCSSRSPGRISTSSTPIRKRCSPS